MTASRWPYFTKEELSCPCGTCGLDTADNMNNDFMNWLVYLRTYLDRPLKVTSGYRCPEYNKRLSSTGLTGPHTTGRAVDIACEGWLQAALIKSAISSGVEGLGIKAHGPRHKRFVHLDCGIPSRHETLTIWTY